MTNFFTFPKPGRNFFTSLNTPCSSWAHSECLGKTWSMWNRVNPWSFWSSMLLNEIINEHQAAAHMVVRMMRPMAIKIMINVLCNFHPYVGRCNIWILKNYCILIYSNFSYRVRAKDFSETNICNRFFMYQHPTVCYGASNCMYWQVGFTCQM